MSESEQSDQDLWPRGWDGHERAQLLRDAQLPFSVKLQWLEDMHRIVMHLQRQRREGNAPKRPNDKKD